MKNQKKSLNEILASEEFQNKMKDFLTRVLENQHELLEEHEKLTIESAFAAYRIYVKEDFDKLSSLQLQNLFNSIDAKLKMLNARRFYFKSDGSKITKLTELI